MFGKNKEKKPKSKARKIIDWVVTGVFAAMIVGLGTLLIISKTSKSQNVFGPTYQKVLTDSMAPTYKVNDIIVLAKADPADIKKRIDEGKSVDVSFHWKVNGQDVSMTHRIEANLVIDDKTISTVVYSEEALVDSTTGKEYHYTFTAHGINKHSEFCKIGGEYGDCTNQTQTFHEYDLIGRVTRKSWFMGFATSIWGLLVLLLVPCMYLIIASVIDICKALDDKEKPQGEGPNGEVKPSSGDPLAGLSEKEKEKLKKQMLDEMLGKKK